MFRCILVPLDGTPFGEQALPVACAIAKSFAASVHLVHVHTGAAVPAGVESLPYLGENVSGTIGGERAYLEAVAERISEAGLRVTTEVTEGPVTPSLERCATSACADLAVVCTHAHGGLTRFWHTGIGEQMLHDLGIPVVLVRPAEEARPESETPTFRHILVPLNGTAAAEQILEHVVPLGRTLGAALTLIRVVRPMMVVGYTVLAQEAHVNHFLLEEQQREAQGYLERIAERLRAAGLTVRTRVVASEDAALAIADAARPGAVDPDLRGADLIAMATHSRGALARAVASSVTDDVLHNTSVPLLLQHAEEPADAGERAGPGADGVVWAR